jgi:hypothetical protein
MQGENAPVYRFLQTGIPRKKRFYRFAPGFYIRLFYTRLNESIETLQGESSCM